MPPITIAQHMSPLTVSIGRDQTLAAAASRMREHKIRHLPVLDGGRLLGILSERDISWLTTVGVSPDRIVVTEAMSDLPYAVEPSTGLAEVVREMERNKYGAALVVEGDRPVGIFTTVDALRVCGQLLEAS